MNCPNCGKDNNKVIDKRNKEDYNTRRRECQECGVRFSTSEIIVKSRETREKVV